MELKADYDKALENRAEANYLAQNWDAAITDYEKMKNSGKSDAIVYERIGLSKYNKGDFAGATTDLKAALQRGSENPELNEKLGKDVHILNLLGV